MSAPGCAACPLGLRGAPGHASTSPVLDARNNTGSGTVRPVCTPVFGTPIFSVSPCLTARRTSTGRRVASSLHLELGRVVQRPAGRDLATAGWLIRSSRSNAGPSRSSPCCSSPCAPCALARVSPGAGRCLRWRTPAELPTRHHHRPKRQVEVEPLAADDALIAEPRGSELAHVVRQLKAPGRRQGAPKLADRDRAEQWSYRPFAAVLLKPRPTNATAPGDESPPGHRVIRCAHSAARTKNELGAHLRIVLHAGCRHCLRGRPRGGGTRTPNSPARGSVAERRRPFDAHYREIKSRSVPIPDFQTLMRPVLVAHEDGNERSTAELRDVISEEFDISEAERQEMIPSGRARLFDNRIGWTLDSPLAGGSPRAHSARAHADHGAWTRAPRRAPRARGHVRA